MRLLVVVFVLLCSLPTAGQAETTPERVLIKGIVCNELPQITRLLEVYNSERPEEAVELVNGEAGSLVCDFGEWVITNPEAVPTPRTLFPSGVWEAFKVTVVGEVIGGLYAKIFDPWDAREKFSALKSQVPLKARMLEL